jgi:hypothetical protein
MTAPSFRKFVDEVFYRCDRGVHHRSEWLAKAYGGVVAERWDLAQDLGGVREHEAPAWSARVPDCPRAPGAGLSRRRRGGRHFHWSAQWPRMAAATVDVASACGYSAAGAGDTAFQPECQVREVRLTASQGLRDHRRRVLEHQEKIDAGQRRQTAEPSDAQLTMPLIGEIRRPEPALPKRRRPRIKKAEPSQPELGES